MFTLRTDEVSGLDNRKVDKHPKVSVGLDWVCNGS